VQLSITVVDLNTLSVIRQPKIKGCSVKPTLQGETDLSRNRGAKAQKRIQAFENTIPFNPVVKQRTRPVELVPKTRNQEKLILQLLDDAQHIVVAVGPAGTGKTYLAMQAAVRAFQQGLCERIILTRPAVGVEDEQHGFLPGNLVAKMEPWTRPLLDVLREHYRPQDIVGMLEDQTIEISPLAYMRGRNFRNSWIIADEMQNATPEQCKMLMTRIAANSKLVITGDVEQADRKGAFNGLLDLCSRLDISPIKGIALCNFSAKDIQRHPIIGEVLKLYTD
jgi:phosphate starvation-inducible protein PhoH and related proteins